MACRARRPAGRREGADRAHVMRLSTKRRELPMVEIDTEYVFDGPAGGRVAARPVRRPSTAHRAALHVRPRVGRRLPELLCRGRRDVRPASNSTCCHATPASSSCRARRSPSSRTTRRGRVGTSRGTRRSGAPSTTTSTSRSTSRSRRSSSTSATRRSSSRSAWGGSPTARPSSPATARSSRR